MQFPRTHKFSVVLVSYIDTLAHSLYSDTQTTRRVTHSERPPMQQTILITGANRGLGLELCKQYLADGEQVIATCRSPENAPELIQLAKKSPKSLTVHPLDICNDQQRRNIQAILIDSSIDILINNAGVFGPTGIPATLADRQAWIHVLEVNCITPYLFAVELMNSLMTGNKKLLVNITSKMGSINDNSSGGSPIYRSSKAALNACMKSLAIDMQDSGLKVLLVHPGWVKTDMGGKNALIDAATSISGIRKLIEHADDYENASYLSYDGTRIPW